MNDFHAPGPLTPNDLQATTQRWSPEQFEVFCRTLIAAVGSDRGVGVGALKVGERPGVADGGVDAELRLPAGIECPETGGLIGPGRTAYQVKWRHPDRDRKAVLRELERSLSEELTRIGEREDLPDRYCVLTNHYLGQAEIARLVEALRRACPAMAERTIAVHGAGELAIDTNARPYLLLLFFPPTPGRTWVTLEEARREHMRAEAVGATIELVDRETERQRLAQLLSSDGPAVIVVTGPTGVGKTRLVLEAVTEYDTPAIWGRAHGDLAPTLRFIDAGPTPPVVVIDDITASDVAPAARAALARTSLRTILVAGSPAPNLPGVAYVALGPLPESDIERLVHGVVPRLDFLHRIRIAHEASGSPRLAAWLAQYVAAEDEDTDLVSLEQRVIDDFCSDLDQETLRALTVFSLLRSVHCSNDAKSDFPVLAQVFGMTSSRLSERCELLVENGHVLRRGPHVEVVPAFLARALARRLVRRSTQEVTLLLEQLDMPSRLRLLERLGEVHVDRQLWMSLLEEGVIGDVHDLASWAGLLGPLAHAVPQLLVERLRDILEKPLPTRGLESWTPGYHELVQAVRILAVRPESFAGAADLLLTLATHEQGWNHRPAETAFLGLFRLNQLQAPVDPAERLDTLQRLMRTSPRTARPLVVRAAADAGERDTELLEIPSSSPDLRDSGVRRWLPKSFERYASGLLAILTDHVSDEDRHVRAEARRGVIEGGPEIVLMASAWPELVDALRRLCDSGFDGPTERARFRSTCERLMTRIDDERDSLAEVRTALAQLLQATAPGLQDPLQARVSFWLGPLSESEERRDEESLVDAGYLASSQAIRRMAHEASSVSEPAPLLETLYGAELPDFGTALERQRLFFAEFGRSDGQCGSLDLLLGQTATSHHGEWLAAYLRGALAREDDAGEQAMDRAEAAAGDLVARAILKAVVASDITEPRRARFERLLRSGRVAAREALQILRSSPWASRLDPGAFERIISVTGVGPTSPNEDQATVLDLVHWRLVRGRPVEGPVADLAWALLHSSPPPRRTAQMARFRWEDLAARLAATDPERGHELLRTVLERDSRFWPKRLWRALRRADRPETVRRVLEALENLIEQGHAVNLILDLPSEIDLVADRQELVGFASSGEDARRARIVAELLDADHPGFWEIAERLLDRWGADSGVQGALYDKLESAAGLVESFPAIWLSRAERARSLGEESESSAVKRWARIAATRLEEAAGQEPLHDYDLHMGDVAAAAASNDAALRRWAVRRVLRHVPPENVGRYLTRKAIEDELPNIDLPPRQRRAWEAAIDAWKRSA